MPMVIRTFIDQMGRQVEVPYPPRRIISLVPSQTELLFDLGLEHEIAGITKFCIHPEEQFRNKTKVGGTKQAHLERIAALAPDLIIGNKEENDRSQIETLAKSFPVWMSDVHDLPSALDMIQSIGAVCDRSVQAEAMAAEIARRFSLLPRKSTLLPAAYLIWRSPYMVAASRTFIHDMLQYAGCSNVFGDLERYPEVTLEELARRQPRIILLSSEPYPFKEKHLQEFQQACPDARVSIVDGEMFSWYGSRLLQAAAYCSSEFRSLWHGI